MVVSAEGFFVLAGFRLAGIALARFRLAGFGLAGLALAGFALPDSDWSGLRWSDSHWKYRQCAPERHRRTWYAASPGSWRPPRGSPQGSGVDGLLSWSYQHASQS